MSPKWGDFLARGFCEFTLFLATAPAPADRRKPIGKDIGARSHVSSFQVGRQGFHTNLIRPVCSCVDNQAPLGRTRAMASVEMAAFVSYLNLKNWVVAMARRDEDRHAHRRHVSACDAAFWNHHCSLLVGSV